MNQPDSAAEPPSDGELLASARTGDRAALAALLARHQARIYRFGMRMCGDPEDARDVLQDTLLAMARGVHDVRGSTTLSSWLYSIARSFCIKRRRKSKFAPAALTSLESDPAALDAIDPNAPSPESSLADRGLREALERAIEGLAPEHREVLLLRDAEGLTAPEVAEVLGIGVAAVKSRLHRARLEVRQEVAPLLGPDAALPRKPACPDVLELYSRHLEGDIDQELCRTMERHLTECERCRGACNSLKQTLTLCSESPLAPVPSEVQQGVRAALARYLPG